MGSYYHRRWECPYYKWDEKCALHCEGGILRLPDTQAMRDFTTAYCCDSWGRCPIARVMNAYYDRKEENT